MDRLPFDRRLWSAAFARPASHPSLAAEAHTGTGADFALPVDLRTSYRRFGLAPRHAVSAAAPAAPCAFDFAREAYFEHLGALGFNFGTVHPEARPRPAKPDPLSTRAVLWLDRLREKLRLRVVHELKGPEGGFAPR